MIEAVGGKQAGHQKWGLIPRLLDALILTAMWGFVMIGTNITEAKVRPDEDAAILTAIIVASTLALFQRGNLYVVKPTLPRTEEIARVLIAVVGGAAAGVVAAAFLDWRFGAWEVIIGTLGSLALLVIGRGLLRTLGELLPGHHEPARVVIVGTGEEARELADVILDHEEARLELVGVIGHLPVAETNGLEGYWIGPAGRLIELMHLHQATGAIVTPTGFRAEQFRTITRDLFKAGFDVHLSTGVSRLWEGRFDVRSLAHEPLVVMESQNPRAWQLAMKRAIDIVGASLLLLLASPIMLMTAVAIMIEDRRPIIFRQTRAGRKAEFFDIFKFRSMVQDAEARKSELEADNERTGPLFKVSDDPRITRVGRVIRELSIDELPQLFNVLRGDMSLVGPRPALTEEEQAFDDELRRRFDVRPGITGLWQVEARSNASFAAYRRLDLHYVENWTLGLDFRILMATTEQVIVTAAMFPVRRLLGRRFAGQAIPDGAPIVIDLRDATTARMAAAEGVQAANSASSPGVADRPFTEKAPAQDGSRRPDSLGKSLSTH